MDRNDLNLARRPFANLRPLKRTATLLWLAGALLMALNARNYWNHFTGENQARARLLEIDAQRSREVEAIRELRHEAAQLRPGSLNERSRFVNQKIEQRTFSWSNLFDRLTEALPNDVRLTSLTPTFSGGRSRRDRAQQLEPGEVGLAIDGVAKNDEELLAFVDAFFEHRAFRRPDLTREQTRDNGHLEFELSVVYRPGLTTSGGEATVDGAPAAEAGAVVTQAEAAP